MANPGLPCACASTSTASATPTLTPTAGAVPTQKVKGQKNNGQTGKGSKGETAPTSSNPNFIATEILGRPTNTSVTANIVPAAAMTVYYEYGTSSGTYISRTQPQNALAGAPLETLISGLQPNTVYAFSGKSRNGAAVETASISANKYTLIEPVAGLSFSAGLVPYRQGAGIGLAGRF